MKCMECGGEMFRSTDPIQSEYKGEDLTIIGVEHWVCDACGEMEFSSDDLDALDRAEGEAYRQVYGLMQPAEIRSLRKRLNLTQVQFESAMGVASPTVSRWETGAVVQTKVADNLMRMMAEYPEVAMDMLERAEIVRPCSLKTTLPLRSELSAPLQQLGNLKIASAAFSDKGTNAEERWAA